MSPVLLADDLARHYPLKRGLFAPTASVKALDGVSFALDTGKTLAVVGESGCGKSTLARQLTLIEAPTRGRLLLQGHDAARATPEARKALRQQVQMVFQNPFSSLNPRHSIARTLAEPLLINRPAMSKAERSERVAAWLDRVGLRPEHGQRYPHMFSGGQRQRIAIARAMMLEPAVVVADEPTSALDVSIQAQILNLFLDLQQAQRTAYVFISHNLAVVEHVADTVMVMYLGRAVEVGDKTQVFRQPLHPYTQALMSATPQMQRGARTTRIVLQGELPSPLNPPSGCAFHQRCPRAEARCKEAAPALREVEGRQVACHLVGA